VLFSTVLWGTSWIPLRELRASGPAGEWWTTLGFLFPLLLLFPVLLRDPRPCYARFRPLLLPSFWLALGIALYSEGVVRGTVARVVLLFYLTPIWSTLLARLVLSQRIVRRRWLAIGLGLAGLWVIFTPGLDSAACAADWMGLGAGVAWALGLIGFQRIPAGPLPDRVFVCFVFLGPLFLLLSGLSAGGIHVELPRGLGSIAWIVVFGGVWMLPVLWLTLFAARDLDPGRMALLLMLEIVIALSSAALLAGEALGPRGIAGAILVVSAIATDVRRVPN